MSWSYGLLDAELQQVFVDLSVFSGSFDAASAAAVCGTDPRQTTDALASLVERSLVMRVPGRRYVLLETLRAFGAEELERTGRVEAVAERHARHQAEWVGQAAQRLIEPGEPVLVEIDAAIPELRSALAWLLDHDELELAGRLTSGLLHYGFLRLRPDVLGWSEQVARAIRTTGARWRRASWRRRPTRRGWPGTCRRAAGGPPARCASLSRPGVRSRRMSSPPGPAALYEGRLDTAAAWYRRSADASAL